MPASNTCFKKFQNSGGVAPATNSRPAPLNPERAGYNYGFGQTVDIPLDASTVCVIEEFVEIRNPFFIHICKLITCFISRVYGFLIMTCFNIRMSKRRKENSKLRRLN